MIVHTAKSKSQPVASTFDKVLMNKILAEAEALAKEPAETRWVNDVKNMMYIESPVVLKKKIEDRTTPAQRFWRPAFSGSIASKLNDLLW